jgi:hypothetical protein
MGAILPDKVENLQGKIHDLFAREQEPSKPQNRLTINSKTTKGHKGTRRFSFVTLRDVSW